MRIYKDGSDEFDPEYLAYLGTLTSEVFDGKMRTTRDPRGEIVRIEVWANDMYYDIPLPGWMKEEP